MNPLSPLIDEIRSSPSVATLIRLALEEDLGSGDVTTEWMVSSDRRARARVLAREPGVFCGLALADRLVELAEADLEIEARVEEGARVADGDVVLSVHGRARDLLTLERTLLNFLQRLGGIATTTRRFVEALKGRPCRLLETRKTVPGWRLLDKYAVLAGGGHNHRRGLYDQVLAKENHFALSAGDESMKDAVDRLLTRRPKGMLVEIEVERIEDLRATLSCGVDIILLDNMTPETLGEAVRVRDEWSRDQGRPGPLLEASGGIDLASIDAVAATGVDRISVGSLTHSTRSLDLSLLIDC